MRKGKIKFINEQLRFGFITDINSSEEFYFRLSGLTIPENIPDPLLLTYHFELRDSKKGAQAVNIAPIPPNS